MKHKLTLLFLLIFCLCGCKEKNNRQVLDIETIRIKNMIPGTRFINYDDVINSLSNSNLITEELSADKFTYILLLDTTDIKKVEKRYPNKIQELREYFNFLDYSKIENNSRKHQMKFIETEIKSLIDCFKDEKVLSEIISNNFGQVPKEKVRLDNDIYIKDDSIAVFILYGIGTECNKAWKVENGLYVEHIFSVMT